MMKKYLLISIALLAVVGATAQNTFFPTREGTVQVYVQKNVKGKVESHTRQTVGTVSGSGDNRSIGYTIEMLDAKMKPLGATGPLKCTLKIVNGVVIMDMNEMAAQMQATTGVKVEVTGVPQQLPGNLKAGDAIKDANVLMKADMGIMKLSTEINTTNGQCVAIEDITTPAGTFKCYKISQEHTTKTMGQTVSSKTITWYANGVGMVRSESYDKKGKLLSASELLSTQ